MSRPAPLPLSDFRHFTDITTRWMDNDVYGHVNNAVYYSFFDTTVSGFLIGCGAVDFASSTVIGLAVESKCSYFAPISFPDRVRGALKVGHLGTSSVRYDVGIFQRRADGGGAGLFHPRLCRPCHEPAGAAAR